MRRCQILLASASGERAPRIAKHLSCDSQTVRNAIHDFNSRGLEALTERSRRPHETHAAFSESSIERLKSIVHQSPRDFGKPTSIWTLSLLADVSYEQGLIASRVSGEAVRSTLKHNGVNWKRAKKWITSPDPDYERKKTLGTD